MADCAGDLKENDVAGVSARMDRDPSAATTARAAAAALFDAATKTERAADAP